MEPNCPQAPALGILTTQNAGTGSTTTGTAFSVPTGRGNVIAVDLVFCSATLADLDGVTVNLAANGIRILDPEAAIRYSALGTWAGKDTKIPVFIKEGSNISYNVVNDQANAILNYLVLYFDGKISA